MAQGVAMPALKAPALWLTQGQPVQAKVCVTRRSHAFMKEYRSYRTQTPQETAVCLYLLHHITPCLFLNCQLPPPCNAGTLTPDAAAAAAAVAAAAATEAAQAQAHLEAERTEKARLQVWHN